ncbi:unnamed protein product, partial [Rotaria sp. Silwood1]
PSTSDLDDEDYDAIDDAEQFQSIRERLNQ